MRSDHNYIDGQFVAVHVERIAVHNPAAGELVGYVSAASAAEARMSPARGTSSAQIAQV